MSKLPLMSVEHDDARRNFVVHLVDECGIAMMTTAPMSAQTFSDLLQKFLENIHEMKLCAGPHKKQLPRLTVVR